MATRPTRRFRLAALAALGGACLLIGCEQQQSGSGAGPGAGPGPDSTSGAHGGGVGIGHSQSSLGRARDAAESTRDRIGAHNQAIEEAAEGVTGR
ncbi:MAG TPA: hypothetical protein PKC43_02410 [Phycisphaerales bacterium]|nr:hypothetical protein [Phycisphaerales bacterium]HMP36278.1 hypothetical protein [Phycisphaerales bacterium]